MKTKLLLTILALLCVKVHAQKGLEKIIVEKYYISNKADSMESNGKLAIGSTTYRVFVDLLPGYRFQAVYGIPGHPLVIKTTTLFYNHEDWGAIIPNVIPDRCLTKNTTLVDSWLSVGAASESNYGVLKEDDNGEHNLVIESASLKSTDPLAGIPITNQDGLVAGTPARPTIFGIDEQATIFKDKTNGSLFSTENGSWASLYGSVGFDSLHTNRVLIGQFTTNGIFSFELNIQIGTPKGGVENYVATNPVANEILYEGLVFSSATNRPKSSKQKIK